MKGFRSFLLRGNIVDLAVAVVIGTAFTALVTSFGRNLIEPVINSVFGLMGLDHGGIGGTIPLPAGQSINVGAIVTAALTFLLTAAVVYFAFVAPLNAAKARMAKPDDPVELEIDLLREIRDLLSDDRAGGESSTAGSD